MKVTTGSVSPGPGTDVGGVAGGQHIGQLIGQHLVPGGVAQGSNVPANPDGIVVDDTPGSGVAVDAIETIWLVPTARDH